MVTWSNSFTQIVLKTGHKDQNLPFELTISESKIKKIYSFGDLKVVVINLNILN